MLCADCVEPCKPSNDRPPIDVPIFHHLSALQEWRKRRPVLLDVLDVLELDLRNERRIMVRKRPLHHWTQLFLCKLYRLGVALLRMRRRLCNLNHQCFKPTTLLHISTIIPIRNDHNYHLSHHAHYHRNDTDHDNSSRRRSIKHET